MSTPRRKLLGVCTLLVLCSFLGWRLVDRQRRPISELAHLLNTTSGIPAVGSGVASATVTKPTTHWIPTITLAQGEQPRFADPKFTNRLRNTAATADQLVRNDHAILLRNAFLDTASSEPLPIPAKLRATGEAGAYVVQANGVITPKFRADLMNIGARIVTYFPNNAFLVTGDAGVGERLAALPEARTLAYEPYFKFEPALLGLALLDAPSPGPLKLILTVPEPELTMPQIVALGGSEVFRERGPFGLLITVEAPGSALVSLGQLSGVHLIESWQPVQLANDHAGFGVGSTTNPENTDLYQGLTGNGVQININDSGVDAGHPDLSGRVFSLDGGSQFLNDLEGHGTHVAGILAGNGSQSGSLAIPPQGSLTNANFQGRAPKAELYVLPVDLLQGPASGDTYLQEAAASNPRRKNSRQDPLISNNSWGYPSPEYSSHSASFDAAVRDALPTQSGDQPMLYVFSAGNSGFGGDNGQGGDFDSVNSPGNAKNVITVGALESLRNLTNALVIASYTNAGVLTNVVVRAGSTTLAPEGAPGDLWPPVATNTAYTYKTNFPFAGLTDTDHQVAGFSSRGNVGIGTEGDAGRFKPDVVAPGTFVVSTRSSKWQLTNDFPLPFFEIEYDLFKDLTAETAPSYRYESGTSMAAPVVAGFLAQLQEYFESKNLRHPSAAGYKALLLNSAQATSPTYYPDPHNAANYGGWGKPNLGRALTSQLTRDGQPLYLLESGDDGQPVGLATGESRSYSLTLGTNVVSAPVRVTLVWTDPPGNPAGAAKLVNDLDLIVSNVITGEVIYGNDFEPGTGFSTVQPTNDITRFDRLNNVERIVLTPDSTTNGSYVISVVAHRVNVNTRTDHPNAIVQDFALAIAADVTLEAGITTVGTITSSVPGLALPGAGLPPVVGVTNGGALFNERVGANSPLINGRIGQTNQWQFYAFTNSPFTNLSVYSITNDAGGNSVTNYLQNGSNVAFVTFPYNAQGNLSHARSNEADIDLYVSLNPALTNLDPVVVQQAFKSTSRGATELVFFTNSPLKGEVYYVGVKSEDQQAVEYGFIGLSTDQPFNTFDKFGAAHVLTVPLRQPIPDGTPDRPGLGLYLAISTLPGEIRGVTPKVTTGLGSVTGGNSFPDLLGNLTHNRSFAVLNNHGQLLRRDFGTVTVTYDDTQSGNYPGSVSSDGPGTLVSFLGGSGTGPWFLTTSDNALGNVSRINYFDLALLPNDFGETFVERCVDGGRISLEVINVPADASRLTITVTNMDPALPLEVFIRRDALPDLTDVANNDKHAIISPPGGDVSIGDRDIPPLQAGRYFIAVFNPNAVRVCYRTRGRLERDQSGNRVRTYTATNLPAIGLTDQASSQGVIHVDDSRPVSAVSVGLRIDHERESDLAVAIQNPQSVRTLLVENRGLQDASGFGKESVTTNTAFSHVAFTFDQTTGSGVLFVNGRSVDGARFPDYRPITSNELFFAGYPSNRLAAQPSGALDDFGLWKRVLRPAEVLNIFRYGLEQTGKRPLDADSGLIALWPFDGTGAELLKNLTVKAATMVGSVPGQIDRAALFSVGGGSAAANTNLDVSRLAGFTVEGWFDATINTPAVIVGWGQTNGDISPALLVNYPPPLGNGIGSVSVLLTNDGSLLLKSPAGLAIPTVVTTNTLYAVFSDLTNGTSQLIKFAEPPYATDTRTRLVAKSDFETNRASINTAPGQVLGGWTVISNYVRLLLDADGALDGIGYLSLDSNSSKQPPRGRIRRTFPLVTNRFYTASFATRIGTRRSAGTNSLLRVFTNGVPATLIQSSKIWETSELTFFAATNSITIDLQSVGDQGVLVDSFRMIEDDTGRYIPEEPTKPLLGNSGLGDWRLELTDGRTNAVGGLLGWQLTLTFAPTNPPAITLTNGISYSTNLVGSEIKYFIVEVPPEAIHTTNFLASLTGGPLNLLYSRSGIPDGLQPEDYTLLSGVTMPGQSYVLTTNLLPNFKPGQRYYLGVQNANPGDNNQFTLQVDFELNIVPLTNNIALAGTNSNQGFINYYSYDISTNAYAVRFALTNLSGDVNLVARRAPVLPTRTGFDFASVNAGLASEEIQILSPDSTNLLTPGRWLLGVYCADTNLPLLPIRYSILASEIAAPLPLTNELPVSGIITNADATTYYYFDLTNDVSTIAFALTNLSGNVNLFLREGFPPQQTILPTPTDFDRASTNAALANELIVVKSADPGIPLVRGRWFLAVVAADPTPISYTVLVKVGSDPVPTVPDLFDGIPQAKTHRLGDPADTFRFTALPNTGGLLFEIYYLNGEADLYAALDALPSQAPPPLFTDLQPGTIPELVVLRATPVNPDLVGTYFLEVRFPGTSAVPVNYTIRGVSQVNGRLESGRPLVTVFLPPAKPGDPFVAQFNSVPGEYYQFEFTDDLFASIVDWIPAPPPVVATGTVTTMTVPLPDITVPVRFYRIVQVAAP